MRPRRDKPLFRILVITLGLAFTAVGVITVHGALTETGLDAPEPGARLRHHHDPGQHLFNRFRPVRNPPGPSLLRPAESKTLGNGIEISSRISSRRI